MTTVLIAADHVPDSVSTALEGSGYRCKQVPDGAVFTDAFDPDVVVVIADRGIELALQRCGQVQGTAPVLLILEAGEVEMLDVTSDLFDSVVLMPLRNGELEVHLRMLLWRNGRNKPNDKITYGNIVLDLATYQAKIAGRPLDMTYMEYELLKYLIIHAGRVVTRAELLKDVWGYEYFGGARTVDVHVRRLRAKLGEEHAGLIGTVRSVGYSFGD